MFCIGEAVLIWNKNRQALFRSLHENHIPFFLFLFVCKIPKTVALWRAGEPVTSESTSAISMSHRTTELDSWCLPLHVLIAQEVASVFLRRDEFISTGISEMFSICQTLTGGENCLLSNWPLCHNINVSHVCYVSALFLCSVWSSIMLTNGLAFVSTYI